MKYNHMPMKLIAAAVVASIASVLLAVPTVRGESAGIPSAFLRDDIDSRRLPALPRTRAQLLSRLLRDDNGALLLGQAMEGLGRGADTLSRTDLTGAPVRQQPIREAPPVDRAFRRDVDWLVGMRFSPNNNARGMVVNHVVLPFGQTLGDIERRDELPVAGIPGFIVRQRVMPMPPAGSYLFYVDLEENPPYMDPDSMMTESTFEIGLLFDGQDSPERHQNALPLHNTDGRVTGYIVVLDIPGAGSEMTISFREDSTASHRRWSGWFRGITVIRL